MTIGSDLTEVIVKQLQMLRKKRPHLLIVIDEIDALSKTDATKMVFKRFIKNIIDYDCNHEVKQKKNLAKKIIEAPSEQYSLSVIGIANSVELFKGELATSGRQVKGNLLQSY